MADDGEVSLPPSVSDCDLPPDVLTQGYLTPYVLAEDVSETDVCVPGPILSPMGSCKNRCKEKVRPQAVLDSREQHLQLSEEDRAQRLFAAVRLQVCGRDGKEKPGRTQWTSQESMSVGSSGCMPTLWGA